MSAKILFYSFATKSFFNYFTFDTLSGDPKVVKMSIVNCH